MESPAAAAERFYVQALNACLSGDTSTADVLLSRLGCTWKLSAAIWAAAATGNHHQQHHAQQEQQGQQEQQAQQEQQLTRQQQQQQRQQQQQQQQQQVTRQQQQQVTGQHQTGPVLCCDCPLPRELLARLQHAFSPSTGDFWSAHAYHEPCTPFFSYLLDLSAAPGNALAAAAVLLQRQAAALSSAAQGKGSSPGAAAAAASATHVEWWCHTRQPWEPHQLHFDVAEGALRSGLGHYRLAHPAAASVVFLSGAGGALLVLHQGVGGAAASQAARDTSRDQPAGKRPRMAAAAPEPLARGGVLVAPAEGRCALWPGHLLHGVLPGCALPTSDAGAMQPEPQQQQEQERRTTLILAWWAQDPRALVQPQASKQPAAAAAAGEQAPLPHNLGPCMTLPEAGSAAWLRALQLPAEQLQQQLAQPGEAAGWRALQLVQPAWERVAAGAEQEAAAWQGLAAAELPPLRFALRDALDIRRAYLPRLADWQQAAAGDAGADGVAASEASSEPDS